MEYDVNMYLVQYLKTHESRCMNCVFLQHKSTMKLGYYGSGVAGYVGLINRLLLLSLYTFILLTTLFVIPSMLNYHRFRVGINKFAEENGTSASGLEYLLFNIFAMEYGVKDQVAANYLVDHSSITHQASLYSDTSTTGQLTRAAVELLEGTVKHWRWTSGAWTTGAKGPGPPSKFGPHEKRAILPPLTTFYGPLMSQRGDSWLSFLPDPPLWRTSRRHWRWTKLLIAE